MQVGIRQNYLAEVETQLINIAILRDEVMLWR